MEHPGAVGAQDEGWRRAQLVQGLLEAARLLNVPLEVEEMMSALVAVGSRMVEATGASLLLLDGEIVRVACAEGGQSIKGQILDAGRGVVGRVAVTGEPQLLAGELLVDGQGWFGPAPHGAMAVPVHQGATVLGVLTATASADRPFDNDDLVAFLAISELIAAAVARTPASSLARAAGSLPVDAPEHMLHDAVTGLANRVLFGDRVDRAFRRWNAHGGPGIAVIVLDLDNFRRVNESWGHTAGDELLRGVAERLDRAVRETDTVARLGGDEFAVLVEGVAGEEEALQAAERVRHALVMPFTDGERTVRIRASVGVVFSHAGSEGFDDMLRDADVALSCAKAKGKDTAMLFEPKMQRTIREQLELEVDLQRAIERDELVLHYQPIFALETGRINGFEALVRWEHPEKGLLYPDKFISLAEDTGLIVGIDGWVMRTACIQGKKWQDAYPVPEPLLIGVNLSVQQLEDDGVVDAVAEALALSGLAPEHLVLEITEKFVLQDEAASARRLEALRALGVQVAIDDFGTGYASLSYLRRLPVDVLKVDRSFVEGLGRTPEDTALVRAILRMATSLDLEVTAEGVERHDQLEELKALGCTSAQGYHFSRPVPTADFDELLRIRFGGTMLSNMLAY